MLAAKRKKNLIRFRGDGGEQIFQTFFLKGILCICIIVFSSEIVKSTSALYFGYPGCRKLLANIISCRELNNHGSPTSSWTGKWLLWWWRAFIKNWNLMELRCTYYYRCYQLWSPVLGLEYSTARLDSRASVLSLLCDCHLRFCIPPFQLL